MFETLSKAKRSAKSQLKVGHDNTKVVHLDSGEFDFVVDDEDMEPCLEQVVGEWTWENSDRLWRKNENYDKTRLLNDEG